MGVGPAYSGTLVYNNLTVSGNQGIHYNAPIVYNSLTVTPSGNLSTSSATSITINPGPNGTHIQGNFHAYIAPACVGGALVRPNGDGHIGASNQTAGALNAFTSPNQNNSPKKQANQIRIYPNPSTQVFNIINTASFKQKPQVFNIMGQEISVTFKKVSKTEYKIDMSGHSKGIYFIHVGVIVKEVVLE